MLKLEIITPDRKVLSTETPWVTVPGEMGELGVLPQHLPLLTTLESGVLQYEQSGKPVKMAIHYGYASIIDDKVTVLSEMVEQGGHIDIERAKKAELKAREEIQRLLAKQDEENHRMNKYEAKLKRALIRQQASGN
ncbi:MAG: F0F1 ATP synthase subunit epsilon [Deltaproteobacteria bacterium]|nr:F0F1 ATP synthase subunit epsilon [Deltaproteobacteria bacterium]